MKEIRFRAWDKAKSHMCFFGPEFDVDDDQYFLAFLTPSGLEPSIGDHNAIERYVIMQYTSLKDKHGQEIYEGDIVRMPSQWWHDNYPSEKMHLALVSDPIGTNLFYAGDWTVEPEEVEVIGNIYENPELLEPKQ